MQDSYGFLLCAGVAGYAFWLTAVKLLVDRYSYFIASVRTSADASFAIASS